MNDPTVIQRFIEGCLRDYWDQLAAAYINDILIYFKDFEEHVGHLPLTLCQFVEKIIELNPSKYKLFNNV